MYEAYNRYALGKGFGICKRRITKILSGDIIRVTRKGLGDKIRDKEASDAGKLRETRCGCSVRMLIANANLTMAISKFI